MSFQKTVNAQQAPAVEGDFASANPRASVVTGEGALVAGTNGVTVGRFAWADGNGVVSNAGTTAPTGFVHRDMQAVIQQIGDEYSMLIPAGYGMTLMAAGDFWGRTSGAAAIGNKVFASTTDGSIKCAAAGATVAGYVETNFHVDSAAADGELFKMSTWG